MNVGRAANLLAHLQQHSYLDFRPNPAAEDLEMWALPLQDEDEARREKWRKERVGVGASSSHGAPMAS